MTADPFEAFKAAQRENWKSFAPLAMTTTPSAAKLVAFAGVRTGQNLLDAGCGTGVVAITARRAGARVTGLDLTPELLTVAKENAAIAELDDITWKQGDVEDLPFRDGGARCRLRSLDADHAGPQPAALPSHDRTERRARCPPAQIPQGRPGPPRSVPSGVRCARGTVLRRQRRPPGFPDDAGHEGVVPRALGKRGSLKRPCWLCGS